METPTTKDGRPLKRVVFEGAQIFVLPHVSEEETIEKFKNRRQHPDWHTVGRLVDHGTTSSKRNGFDY